MSSPELSLRLLRSFSDPFIIFSSKLASNGMCVLVCLPYRVLISCFNENISKNPTHGHARRSVKRKYI